MSNGTGQYFGVKCPIRENLRDLPIWAPVTMYTPI